MEFVENIVEQFAGGGGGRREEVVEERSTYYGGGPPAPSGPPLPRPWVARWSDPDGRWYYVNEETGERTWERIWERQQYGYGGGYGGGYQREEIVEEQRDYYEEDRPKKDHRMLYGVAGAAAGVVGGALLMHEGEKIRMTHYKSHKRVEARVN
jgi:hypothetical protein